MKCVERVHKVGGIPDVSNTTLDALRKAAGAECMKLGSV
jgi:hypothetical protein